MIKLKQILLENKALSSNVDDTISFLNTNKDKKVLFITTSTRYPFNTNYDKGGVEEEIPKSTELALFIKKSIPNNSKWIDMPQLKIVPCEGNVSHKTGNTCGIKDSLLKDNEKNPSGYHRCWASVNDKSDELWKVSKELFESDIIIFFASIRWGQANSEYQKLIERLTWIENRHSTLGESNVISKKQAGFICIGQNWNGVNVVDVQKKVLEFYGFNTPDRLFWNWQYTSVATDESNESYKKAYKKFKEESQISIKSTKEA
jgi:multimeric flavodoxin WrbA